MSECKVSLRGKKVLVDIDTAKKERKVGMDEEAFIGAVQEKQDERYNQLHYHVIFFEKEQEDGTKKVMTYLPSGKVMFPDRKEDLSNLKLGFPYICMVFERETEAFAKIVCEEYFPTLWVNPNGNTTPIFVNNKGEVMCTPVTLTKEEQEGKIKPSMEQLRLIKALMILKKSGAERVMIEFIENNPKRQSVVK